MFGLNDSASGTVNWIIFQCFLDTVFVGEMIRGASTLFPDFPQGVSIHCSLIFLVKTSQELNRKLAAESYFMKPMYLLHSMTLG